jgi:hypothetical protein
MRVCDCTSTQCSDAVGDGKALFKLALVDDDISVAPYNASRPPPNATSATGMLRSLLSSSDDSGGTSSTLQVHALRGVRECLLISQRRHRL